MGELLALARGLYPPALDRADLTGALTDLARRSPIPTALEVRGELRALPESHRAAASWSATTVAAEPRSLVGCAGSQTASMR
jgi:hypothetical protein